MCTTSTAAIEVVKRSKSLHPLEWTKKHPSQSPLGMCTTSTTASWDSASSQSNRLEVLCNQSPGDEHTNFKSRIDLNPHLSVQKTGLFEKKQSPPQAAAKSGMGRSRGAQVWCWDMPVGRPSRRFSLGFEERRGKWEWDAGREDARDAVACCVLPFNAGEWARAGIPCLSHRGRSGGRPVPLHPFSSSHIFITRLFTPETCPTFHIHQLGTICHPGVEGNQNGGKKGISYCRIRVTGSGEIRVRRRVW